MKAERSLFYFLPNEVFVNIDLSQQAISKFPLSEVKINFIRNFEIFETYCILEYDKTLLY